MAKVSITDKRVREMFQEKASAFFGLLAIVLIFIDIPDKARIWCGVALLLASAIGYLLTWKWADNLNHISVDIEGSTVDIKVGDIFAQEGLKAIAFNEFFDTQVDDRIISGTSINGVFITKRVPDLGVLNDHIDSYGFDPDAIEEDHVDRKEGRRTRYRLGTICVYQDFLLTAFSKFDSTNKASLTMAEYLEFLIAFWDRVNRVYSQRSVSTTIFGSGITRIKGHRDISDEDLLKIMLWTFRISEMRFKYPAKLTIVIHEDKIDRINLLDIKAVRNGV